MKDWILEIDPGVETAMGRAHKDGCSCRGGSCGPVGCGCAAAGYEEVSAEAFRDESAYREDAERLYRVIGLIMKQHIGKTRN